VKRGQFEFFVRLISCINAMYILYMLRKFCSSVIMLLIPIMLNCNIFIMFFCVVCAFFVFNFFLRGRVFCVLESV